MNKLAEQLDGIDVADKREGDVLDLPPDKATILIQEQWAAAERRNSSMPPVRAKSRRAEDAIDAAKRKRVGASGTRTRKRRPAKTS